MFRNEFVRGQVKDVLNNRLANETTYQRKIDLAFWQHGLHDYGWFNTPPYGPKYYEQMVTQWKEIRLKTIVPSVWLSMNPECKEKINFQFAASQAEIVEDCNYYTNQMMLNEHLPYWDTAAVLHVPDRCSYSADGVHVKMFVDIMRAKMLFNHLCDSEMNWRGSIEYFL